MISAVLALASLLQARPSPQAAPREVAPVLAFPEAGLDDSGAYQGYQTRLYRDGRKNSVQIYLDQSGGRVVNLWADAANESLGFTVRDSMDRPLRLAWGDSLATVSEQRGVRRLEYGLTAAAGQAAIGLFLLGSMRVERDYQYSRAHLKPMTAPPAAVVEESLLVSNIGKLPVAERRRHLALLGASSLGALGARLAPGLSRDSTDTAITVRIRRTTLDGRNHLELTIGTDPRTATLELRGSVVRILARPGSPVHFRIGIATDAAALTPLTRERIFRPQFLAYLKGQASSTAGRRLEREVRSVELLASEEKLMAGLPNFATYFGRDMLMTALMMQPIWTGEMSEHVIGSVLRKLGPKGDVSHEEALGGQAIREAASEYNGLLDRYFSAGSSGRSGDSLLVQASVVLARLQRVRENYHMLDDEFQLPLVVARYLSDSTVTLNRKRQFLLGKEAGVSPLSLLLRELALVARETRDYVDHPDPMHLVSFEPQDATHWRSASWRDSGAGYANGRFAMDINAIWVPQALNAIATILEFLPRLGLSATRLESLAPASILSPLKAYRSDPAELSRAIRVWQRARRHFLVTIDSTTIATRVSEKLAWLPAEERSFWAQRLTGGGLVGDSLTFYALSLDAQGKPIPVVNSDPATDLFLRSSESEGADTVEVWRDLDPFLQPYPAGLLVEQVGPVAANDTYASREIWEAFRGDEYHSPRVVWGREVNLLFLGLAGQITWGREAGRSSRGGLDSYRQRLRQALDRTRAAVMASGLEHNELWSYRVEDGKLRPTRYGSGSDVQLWSTTDLAVQFVLSQLDGF